MSLTPATTASGKWLKAGWTTTTERVTRDRGLSVEDHSSSCRIEPIWPDGVLVGLRSGEASTVEVRPHKHCFCQCCFRKVRLAQIDVSEIAVRQVDTQKDLVGTIKRPVDFFKTSA